MELTQVQVQLVTNLLAQKQRIVAELERQGNAIEEQAQEVIRLIGHDMTNPVLRVVDNVLCVVEAEDG